MMTCNLSSQPSGCSAALAGAIVRSGQTLAMTSHRFLASCRSYCALPLTRQRVGATAGQARQSPIASNVGAVLHTGVICRAGPDSVNTYWGGFAQIPNNYHKNVTY